MNEIKIYLKTSGSFAELYKDFNLYQGCYRNSQISVYVPRSILYANAENTFANLVKVGGILTAPNGTKLTTKSYYLDYVKEETVNTIDYAVYTTITPKEFCVYAGTQTVVVNVENIDNTNAEAPTILSATTTQTANLIVLESAYLGQDEPIDPTELEKLRATLTVIQENVTELQTSVTGLRGEVSMIETDLEQVHTDLGEKANKDYVDTELGKKFDKTGGPINGDLLVGGELRVLDDTIIIGNLTVHGTTITEDAETIMSKANVIVTNSEGAPLTQLSGIGIRTNATLVYGIMYDPGDDTVKLGEGTLDANNEFMFNPGEGTAVSTRADSALWTNGHLAQWNGAEYRFIDSGIAAGNVVTINTTQQITGQKSFLEPVLSSDSGTSRNTAEYAGTYIKRIDEGAGEAYTYSFPGQSGVLALKSDVPTDYVTQEEFEKAQRSISDIYTILGQTVILWQSLTQEYIARETAAGMDIIDGALTEVKEIRGKTVKTTNEFAITNLANTDYLTVSGTTITVTNRYDCNSLKTLRQLCPNIHAGTYTASVNVSANTDLSNASGTIALYSSDGLLYLLPQHTAGQLKNVFILSNEDLDRPVYFFGMSEGTVTWDKLMILEGDWTNKEDLSYSDWFAGLKNVFFKEIVSTGRNLFSGENATGENCTYENGVAKQIAADNSSFRVWKVQLYKDTTLFVSQVDVEFSNTGRTPALTIEKTSAVNRLVFGLNGSSIDTLLSIYISEFPNGKYTITWNVLNTTQGSISWNDIMLNYGSVALPYEPYISDTLSAENPIELAEYDVAYPETGETKRNSGKKVFDGTETWEARGSAGDLYRYGAVLANVKTSGACVANLSGENSGASVAGNYFIDTEFKVFTNIATVDEWKAHLAEIATAGNPLTVIYETAEATTEATPFDKSKYIAWKNGSETIEQGTNDNGEYGAENTVTQNYATKRGGTTE